MHWILTRLCFALVSIEDWSLEQIMLSLSICLIIAIPFITIPAKKTMDSILFSRRTQSTTRTQDLKSSIFTTIMLLFFSFVATMTRFPLDLFCMKFATPTVLFQMTSHWTDASHGFIVASETQILLVMPSLFSLLNKGKSMVRLFPFFNWVFLFIGIVSYGWLVLEVFLWFKHNIHHLT